MQRGIIVVDSSSLYRLDSRVPVTDSANQSITRYTDMLRYLARQGYTVLIPEMVAYECASITADDEGCLRYFTHQKETQKAKDFLIQAQRGQLENISIVKSESDAPYAEFMDRMRTLLAMPLPPRQMRLMVQKMPHHAKHAGEEACAEMIESLLSSTAQPPPIYFLCEDKEAAQNIKERFGTWVSNLNVAGLLRAAFDSGIAERAGFAHPSRDAWQDHIDNIYKQQKAICLNNGDLNNDKAHHGNVKSSFVVVQDDEYFERHRRSQTPGPFLSAMMALENELCASSREDLFRKYSMKSQRPHGRSLRQPGRADDGYARRH